MEDDNILPPPHRHMHEIERRQKFIYCYLCQRRHCLALRFKRYIYSIEWINRLEFMYEDENRPVEGLLIMFIHRHLFRIFLFKNTYVQPLPGQRLPRIPVCVYRLVNSIYPIDEEEESFSTFIGFRSHITNRVRAVNVDGHAIDNMFYVRDRTIWVLQDRDGECITSEESAAARVALHP